jgi:hypothetical protein
VLTASVARTGLNCHGRRAVPVRVGEVTAARDQLVSALAVLPAEAFLDGPPVDGDLLLRRILRRVRHERDQPPGPQLAVSLQSATRWVRINARITGIAVGRRCRLEIVARDGGRRTAGDWTVAEPETVIGCVALMAPADVAAVEVCDTGGVVLAAVTVG